MIGPLFPSDEDPAECRPGLLELAPAGSLDRAPVGLMTALAGGLDEPQAGELNRTPEWE